MAKTLQAWLDTDVEGVKDKSVRWMSEFYCFRDPARPISIDPTSFFAPADGIILYQKIAAPDACIVEIKGQNYTLRDALQNPTYAQESLVIGIFMTYYDVHVNRIPLGGILSYKLLDPVQSFNHPMLEIEKSLLDSRLRRYDEATYLLYNERVVNKIFAPAIKQCYYVLQIADYDVSVITPFTLKQHQPVFQNSRFSQIRYGSQVDLIVPLSKRYDFECVQTEGMHVEAGMDKLVKIQEKPTPARA